MSVCMYIYVYMYIYIYVVMNLMIWYEYIMCSMHFIAGYFAIVIAVKQNPASGWGKYN